MNLRTIQLNSVVESVILAAVREMKIIAFFFCTHTLASGEQRVGKGDVAGMSVEKQVASLGK